MTNEPKAPEVGEETLTTGQQPWTVHPTRFLKRSGIVEAVQFDGYFSEPEQPWLREALNDERVIVTPGKRASVTTPKGQMWLLLGDWLLKTEGGLFPMKAEYFNRDYLPDWLSLVSPPAVQGEGECSRCVGTGWIDDGKGTADPHTWSRRCPDCSPSPAIPDREEIVGEAIDEEWRAIFGDSPDSFANPGTISHDEFASAIRGALAKLEGKS